MTEQIKMARYAVRSTKQVELGREGAYPLYWNFTAWSGNEPNHLMTREEAERELARLRQSLPHDHTLCLVDFVELRAINAKWRKALDAELNACGYAAMAHSERSTDAGKALRRQAVAKANEAHPERCWVPEPRMTA